MDLAYCHPLDNAFDHFTAGIVTDNRPGLDLSEVFGNDEDFKPGGRLLLTNTLFTKGKGRDIYIPPLTGKVRPAAVYN